MSRTDAQVVHHWTSLLAGLKKAEGAARHRYIWHPNRTNKLLLDRSKAAVARAEKVIDRHTPVGITADTLAFITKEEGVKLFLYDDATELPWGSGPGHSREGTATIGTGLTGPDFPGGKIPSRITLSENNRVFKTILTKVYLPPVVAACKRHNIELHGHPKRVTGLTSFGYNLGIGAFSGTNPNFGHFNRAMASGKINAVAEAMRIYDDPGDPRVHAGLARRRDEEALLVLA